MLIANPVDLLLPTPVHLVALLLVLCGLAFRSSRPRWRRWRYPLAALAAWAWLMSAPAVANALARSLENDYGNAARAPVADVIVVLAAGESFEPSQRGRWHLDLASLRRTLAGVSLWQRHGGTLIFSGSAWPGEPQPVSTRMAALAHMAGVPRRHLRTETASSDTYENLRNVARMLPKDRPFVLVTSALHMPRAMAVARSLGLEALPYPCDFRSKAELGWYAWLPNSRSLALAGWVLHEYLGALYYRLRGWI